MVRRMSPNQDTFNCSLLINVIALKPQSDVLHVMAHALVITWQNNGDQNSQKTSVRDFTDAVARSILF